MYAAGHEGFPRHVLVIGLVWRLTWPRGWLFFLKLNLKISASAEQRHSLLSRRPCEVLAQCPSDCALEHTFISA